MWPLSYWNLKFFLQYALHVLVFISWSSQYPLYYLFLQLINVHRKQRLEFAKKHLKFKRWRNVIFLNEIMVNFKKVEVLLLLFTDDREICKTPTNRWWKYNHNGIIKRRKLYLLQKFYYIIYLITCIMKCLNSEVLILGTVQTFNIIVIIVYNFYIQSIFRHQ